MNEILYMNGYGAYVWGSYAICFTLLGALLILSLRAHKHLKRDLEKEKQS